MASELAQILSTPREKLCFSTFLSGPLSQIQLQQSWSSAARKLKVADLEEEIIQPSWCNCGPLCSWASALTPAWLVHQG
jgi:hypothetical protein